LALLEATKKSNPAIGKKQQFEQVKEIRLETVCSKSSLGSVAKAIKEHHPYEEPAWEVYSLQPKPQLGKGQGRLYTLSEKTTLSEIINKIKLHLGISHLRVATPRNVLSDQVQVQTIALCCGSGYSVIRAARADVLFTGEARHHDVLEAVRENKSVILCEHTHTERGYLKVFQEKLRKSVANDKVQIFISETDTDPLRTV